MRIVYSLLGIVAGSLILIYSAALYRFFGQDMDLENIFGSGLGGTHTFIKLFGLAITVISLLFLFNIFK